jgi:hypothetical protein
MEVIAIKPGFHGTLRSLGDRFTVPDGSSASWFRSPDQPVPEKPPDQPVAAKRGRPPKSDK